MDDGRMKTMMAVGSLSGATQQEVGSSSPKRIEIVLAHRQSLVSDALAAALIEQPEFEIVGVANVADEAVELALRHRPGLVVLDDSMQGMSAIDAARAIKRGFPAARVAILVGRMTDATVGEALRADAVGIIDTDESLEIVVRAIGQVARGKTYFSPSVHERLIVSENTKTISAIRQTRGSGLSPRELEVLRYIATGFSAKEVAVVLHISERTVNNHRTNLMNKLDIHDRVSLARYALREGYVTL